MYLALLPLLKRKIYIYQSASYTSGGMPTTKAESLCPVLCRLLGQELIIDRKLHVGKRMTRIYYHL